MIDPATARKRHKRQLLLLLLLIFVVAALVGFARWRAQVERLQAAQVQTRNYVAFIETGLSATLTRIDSRLRRVIASIPDGALDAAAAPRFSAQINADLDARKEDFADLLALRVFDANGEVLYSSKFERSEETTWQDSFDFRHRRGSPHPGLLISDAREIGSSGRSGIAISRAVLSAQGKFRGVVLAAVALDEYTKSIESADVGTQGVVLIRRSDSFYTVMRKPSSQRELNRADLASDQIRTAVRAGQAQGTFEFPGLTDGVVRIYSYRLVSGFPLYVAVGLARDEVLATWKTQTVAIALVITVLFALALTLLIRLGRRQGADSTADARQ